MSSANQLAAVGQSISNNDLISLVMNGLNPSFTNFITSNSITTREKQLKFDDFHDELLNHEMLLNQQHTVALDPSTFAFFLHIKTWQWKSSISEE
jgi:hypothetical protein